MRIDYHVMPRGLKVRRRRGGGCSQIYVLMYSPSCVLFNWCLPSLQISVPHLAWKRLYNNMSEEKISGNEVCLSRANMQGPVHSVVKRHTLALKYRCRICGRTQGKEFGLYTNNCIHVEQGTQKRRCNCLIAWVCYFGAVGRFYLLWQL